MLKTILKKIMIPFRVKKLTKTAKAPTRENAGDLWDLYADDFKIFSNNRYIMPKKNYSSHGCYIDHEEVGSYINYTKGNLVLDCDGVFYNPSKSLDFIEKIKNFLDSINKDECNSFCLEIGNNYNKFFKIYEIQSNNLLEFISSKYTEKIKSLENLSNGDNVLVITFGNEKKSEFGYSIESKQKIIFKAKRVDKESINCSIAPQGRILVKTGISIELPKYCKYLYTNEQRPEDALMVDGWSFTNTGRLYDDDDLHNDIKPVARTHGFPLTLESKLIKKYAVADIRPRSGLALKHGITVLNTPGTIDNSYRKEIGVILYNAGREPYTIAKGDKIAQMLIRPLYPSKMEIVEHIEDTGRGGYGSTGK